MSVSSVVVVSSADLVVLWLLAGSNSSPRTVSPPSRPLIIVQNLVINTKVNMLDKIRFEWADIIYDMSKARHL